MTTTSLLSAKALVHARNGQSCLPIQTSEGGSVISVSFDGQNLSMGGPTRQSKSNHQQQMAGGFIDSRAYHPPSIQPYKLVGEERMGHSFENFMVE
jgi:hypothetical protein